MELGLGSIAFIYDSIKNSRYNQSDELLLYSIDRTFEFAEENDIKICELILDPPELLINGNRHKFIDLCDSYPSIKKQFHAPYAYLSLCTHNPWILDATLECYIKSAEICEEIGAQVLTLHPGNAEFLHHSYNGINNPLIDSINKLLEEIEDLKLITCLENMPQMAGFFLIHNEIDKLFTKINRNDIYFAWDTGHTYSCKDHLELIWEKLHTRMKNIHLVDYFDNSSDLHPMLGRGTVDFDKIFELADQYNYKGALVIELHNVEDLPESLEFMRNYI
jgi:sugar phosphate isomerase/epimerase